jgi:hypothetical protein
MEPTKIYLKPFLLRSFNNSSDCYLVFLILGCSDLLMAFIEKMCFGTDQNRSWHCNFYTPQIAIGLVTDQTNRVASRNV